MELYKTHSKQGYPIIYEGREANVLFRESCQMLPYVVATGYDAEQANGATVTTLMTCKRRSARLKVMCARSSMSSMRTETSLCIELQ